MKVKATVNLGRHDYQDLFPFLAGEVREVPDSIGVTLLNRGHAVEVAKRATAIASSPADTAEPKADATKPEKPVPSAPLANFQSRKK